MEKDKATVQEHVAKVRHIADMLAAIGVDESTGTIPTLRAAADAFDRLQSLPAQGGAVRAALEQIERWDGFPETGEFWDREKTQPISYGAQFGSNGERDFMREIARKALSASPSPELRSPGYIAKAIRTLPRAEQGAGRR